MIHIHQGIYIINGKEYHNTMTSQYRQSLLYFLGYNLQSQQDIRIDHFQVGTGTTPALETDTSLQAPYPTLYTPESTSIIVDDYLFTYFLLPKGTGDLEINEIGMFNSSNQLLSRVVLSNTIRKQDQGELYIQRKDIITFRDIN